MHISAHLKIVSVEISAFTCIKRVVMTRRNILEPLRSKSRIPKTFRVDNEMKNTEKSKVSRFVIKTAGIPKTPRKIRVAIFPQSARVRSDCERTQHLDTQWSFKIWPHNGVEAAREKVNVSKKPCQAFDF